MLKKINDIHPSPLSGRSIFWNLRKKDYLRLVCSLLNNHRPEGCHWWDGEGGPPEAPGSVAQAGTERLFCRKRLHPRLLLWGLHKTLVLPVSPWVSKIQTPHWAGWGLESRTSREPSSQKRCQLSHDNKPIAWVGLDDRSGIELPNCPPSLPVIHMASSATTHPVGYIFVHTIKQLHAFVHFCSN